MAAGPFSLSGGLRTAVAGLLAGSLALAPIAASPLGYSVEPVERQPVISSAKVAVSSVAPPRRVSLAEAIRIANSNFARVEAAMAAEVERDSRGPAVWEEE
jgi:hypothetical protein